MRSEPRETACPSVWEEEEVEEEEGSRETYSLGLLVGTSESDAVEPMADPGRAAAGAGLLSSRFMSRCAPASRSLVGPGDMAREAGTRDAAVEAEATRRLAFERDGDKDGDKDGAAAAPCP